MLNIFDPAMVADRWLKSYQILDMVDSHSKEATDIISKSEALQIEKLPKPKEKGTLSQSQKYTRLARSLLQFLLIVECQSFRETFSTIEAIIGLWDKNVPFCIQMV